MATTKEDILDAISNMTVIELKELLDAFEGSSTSPLRPVAVAAAGGVAAAAPSRRRRTSSTSSSPVPAQKIQVIKAVRD
jgi:large subunit ribosomal protein L7/L12